MSAIVIDSGKGQMLDFLCGNPGSGLSGAKCHLYVNNVSPAHSDLLTAYTEASFTGYAVGTCTGWQTSHITGDFHASTAAAPINFTNSTGSAQLIYGYYITDSSSSKLLLAERFAGAPLSLPAFNQLQVTPNMTLTSEF